MRRVTRLALIGLLFLLAACASAAPPAPLPAAVDPSPQPTAVPTLPQPTAAPTAALSAPATVTVPPEPATPLPQPTTQASLGDPYYPDLGNGGYDALRYTIDLAADVERNVITGTVAIGARAGQDLRAFNLDFQGFTIREITVGDRPATYTRAGRELTITPADPIESGDGFTATVSYAGSPRPFFPQAVPIQIGWNAYAGGAYVMGEPSGAAAWFPVNDHPRDKALYTFRVTVAEPYVVAANGLLLDTIDNGATRTYVWETRHPMASYLATVNIASFVTETQAGPGGLPIRNYFPPSVAANASLVFSRTIEMIAFFSEVFGPYPFEAYGVAVADQPLGFALETQTLSLFGSDIAGAPPDAVQPVVAHELAHQWFGNSVSVANWQDIWLNEGFASYAEWLWLEHTEGRAALDEAVRATEQRLADENQPPPGAPPPGNLFNQGVYARGGLTLHALRLHIGDDAFFQTLKTYAERYQYGNASTADFIAVAEELSRQDLDDFFEGWLYDAAPPELG